MTELTRVASIVKLSSPYRDRRVPDINLSVWGIILLYRNAVSWVLSGGLLKEVVKKRAQ